MSTATQHFVKVLVANDRLQAWLEPDAPAHHSRITAALVQEELAASKIAVTDGVTAKINEFLEVVKDGKALPDKFLIAEGALPVEGKDGEFELARIEDQQPDDDDPVVQIDYRTLNMIRTVAKGEVIGKIHPVVRGRTGVDVYGNDIPPKHRAKAVELASNVKMADDGVSVIARADGRVVFKQMTVRINEVLEIKGDVNFESGNVDSKTDVSITGTICDLFQVKSRKSVTVGGAIEAADVTADEDLIIRGGVCGRGKGKIAVGGNVVAKFCDEADIRAGREVQIAKEAINSNLHSEASVDCGRGAIIGGRTYARLSISARTLGSEGNVKTEIRVGVPEDVLWEVRRIDKEVKKKSGTVKHIRRTVKPLLDNLKRLTPSQKEQATELMFKADSMEMEIEEAKEKQKKMLEDGNAFGNPFVMVQSTICQGVTIAIGDRVTHFAKELKGPVKIEKGKLDNVTEFIAINQLTASVTRLPSIEIDIEPPAEE